MVENMKNNRIRYVYMKRTMKKSTKGLCKLRLTIIFCLIAVMVCQSAAHCVPATEWHLTNAAEASEHDGANTYTTAYLNVSFVDPKTKLFLSDKSELGKYGDGRIGPAEGLLVHVSSEDGDHTGCAAPLRSTLGDGSLPTEPWIALIKRGQCSFEVKIENAFKHNATAVLVYNDRESPILDKMKLNAANNSIRNMSSIFTYKWKGELLARLIDKGSRVRLHISVATRCIRSNNTINRTSVLFVSISFVVLMLISMAWLVFYYVQRFRYMHAKEKLSKRLCNAAKKALSKIPTKEVQQEDTEVQGEGECCAVCIESYKVTDDLRILPCSHEFHKKCIDPWLLEHRTCPMCKMDILKHYGFEFNKSHDNILEMEVEREANPQGLDEATVSESTLIRRNDEEQNTSSDFQVLSGGRSRDLLQMCQQCRCPEAKTGKSEECCCLIDKLGDSKYSDPDTAQLLENDDTQTTNEFPAIHQEEINQSSSQIESINYMQSGDCDNANEDGSEFEAQED